LSELNRQYAAKNQQRRSEDIVADPTAKQFRPQPYIQLAKIFDEAGYDAAAKKVRVQFEKNKTRYGGVGFLARIWRHMLGLFLLYGYESERALYAVLACAFVSWIVFQFAYDSNQIKPSKDNEVQAQAPYLAPHARVPFYASIYAVDTLVPIIDLNQKKNWVVTTTTSDSVASEQRTGWLPKAWQLILGWGPYCLLIFNTFFGWLMTTLFVAGVSGFLRTARKV
jgi:hypothetical protein